MNETTSTSDRLAGVPAVPLRRMDLPGKGGPRGTPKGRQVAPADRERVAALCQGLDSRADLLIEHLHRLNDAEGALRKGHLAALAERLRLSQVEVFEVASFYHHFQIVDDDAPVATTTVRVCTSLDSAKEDEILPLLDKWAGIIRRING